MFDPASVHGFIKGNKLISHKRRMLPSHAKSTGRSAFRLSKSQFRLRLSQERILSCHVRWP
jgi:hypothetical protein